MKRNNGKVQINMKIISITGGVGSGKSEVLRVLQEEFDAEIIKADEVAHQLMEPGKKGYQHVVPCGRTAALTAKSWRRLFSRIKRRWRR